MRRAAHLLTLSCSLLLGLANAAVAQHPTPSDALASSDPPQLSEAQDRELTKWLTAMEKWQRHEAKWSNRPVRDGWGRIAQRQPPPEPPEWLDAHCAAAVTTHVLASEPESRTAQACRLLADPRAPMKSVPTPAQSARLDAEKKPKHSSFLTRVHLDGLWSTTSTSGRFYGLVGSHVSLVDVGRVQVFGPPGVLLLSVPDTDGSRRITLGYTWGVSVRLMDVRLFGPTKDKTLFINLSKVWLGSGSEDSNSARGYDIVGFSIAPRKKK
jgi:hypothetical protein